MKVAFYGRVSTDEKQDPSLSIPRQLRKCNEALAKIGETVGPTYWEVDSGRKELDARGREKRDWDRLVSVPRRGDLKALLADARDGAFDAVMVDEISRISRQTYDGTRLERELGLLDILLFAADEPLDRNATATLTRRVKQGVAEWYVQNLLEKSREGMEESVRQGWHAGGPAPYGYALEPHPHPNPTKAREGLRKHKLVLDPVRAPIVHQIFTWYVVDKLGLGAVCERLNRDLDRHPPPKRNRKDENDLIQTWSRSQIQFMLRNPKYTGYNVWNRHDKRPGRPLLRPRDQWVWSSEPTHEPIVARELFDAVEGRAHLNSRSNPVKPRTRERRTRKPSGRLYVLRGRIRCGLCGRRMEGSHQKGSNWYRCQYGYLRGKAAADVSGHPRVLGVKEDVLLEVVRGFMAERLFGEDRLRLLAKHAAEATGEDWKEHDAEMNRLRREKAKIEKALYRQALRLEEHDDPDHPVVKLATQRIEALSEQEATITASIASLDRNRPDGTDPAEVEAMLDAIPDLRSALAEADGEELVQLFDAFDIAVSYDKPEATLEVSASLRNHLPERAPEPATAGGSQVNDIAGAGFEPATFGL